LKNRAPPSNRTPLWANADITGKRELIQQLDIDAESIENDDYGFNSDVSLDLHQ